MTVTPIERFAAEVGASGPVCVVGGRTAWHVGGAPWPGCREVTAPVGVTSFEPAEMVVDVGAGTSFAELDAAVGEAGQEVVMDPADPWATVGGILAVGRSGLRRLRHGHLRDVVLRARFVDGHGRVVTAGGGTVKNVAGYDLCRLLVGSLGTLGLIGEVRLRTRPRPAVARWYAAEVDPEQAQSQLYRPASILWDGATTWVQLEGYEVDVEAEERTLIGSGFESVAGPPPLPPQRWSVEPGAVRAMLGRCDGFVAEIGVGVVHCHEPQPPRSMRPPVAALAARVKLAVDPDRRLNPGRDPGAVA